MLYGDMLGWLLRHHPVPENVYLKRISRCSLLGICNHEPSSPVHGATFLVGLLAVTLSPEFDSVQRFSGEVLRGLHVFKLVRQLENACAVQMGHPDLTV